MATLTNPVPTKGLAYELSSNGTYYTCTGIGTATETDVVIASEIDGIPVTEIAEYAFESCSNLTSVIIPDSVTSIGSSAFEWCDSLTSITIGKGVTNIGGYAFSECSSLTDVYITDIAAWCKISFNDSNTANPLNYAQNLYLNGTLVTELVIPSGVTSIGNYAFYEYDSLTSITIPDSVMNIGDNAFSYCSRLTSVTIGNGVTSVGVSVFEGCNSLTSITIPDSVMSIGSSAFCWCSSLIQVIMGKNLTTIYEHAFSECFNIKQILFERGIKEIKSQAFSGCDQITTVYLPRGVKVAEDAFEDSVKLIYVPELLDFIGFTYNGKHSHYDFGIYRTSDGSRYNNDLVPSMNDKTADIPGGDGQYFFNTTYKNRTFSIPIAFDGLTEKKYHEMRKWLNGREIHELIFDELPYKIYSAKVTGTPQLKTICFDDENGQRVYKGEGTIQFTCYYPFAHTPDGQKGLADYPQGIYSNLEEWKTASGLDENFVIGSNNGDLPAPFTFKMDGNVKNGDKLKVGVLEITIKQDCSDIEWDSKTGLVCAIIGDSTDTKKPIQYSGRSYGTIPTEGINPEDICYITSYLDEQTETEIKRKFDINNKIYDWQLMDGGTEYAWDYIDDDELQTLTLDYDFWYY